MYINEEQKNQIQIMINQKMHDQQEIEDYQNQLKIQVQTT